MDISTDNISIRSNKSRDSNSSNGLTNQNRPIKGNQPIKAGETMSHNMSHNHINHKIQITSKKEIGLLIIIIIKLNNIN